MITSRKGLKLHVAPTDRQLWAIGMVVVQWSGLETMIRLCVYGLTPDDPEARRAFDEKLNTKLRLSMFRDLADQRMIEPFRSQMLSIISSIKELQSPRDKIVHGMWEGHPQDIEHPDWVRAFGLEKPRPAYVWKLTFAQILEVARRIDATHVSLIQLIASARETEDNFTISGALGRTLRTAVP